MKLKLMKVRVTRPNSLIDIYVFLVLGCWCSGEPLVQSWNVSSLALSRANWFRGHWRPWGTRTTTPKHQNWLEMELIVKIHPTWFGMVWYCLIWPWHHGPWHSWSLSLLWLQVWFFVNFDALNWLLGSSTASNVIKPALECGKDDWV